VTLCGEQKQTTISSLLLNYVQSILTLNNSKTRSQTVFIYFVRIIEKIGFGVLEVKCWPLVHKFTGSNPAEAFGFLGRKKSSARLPSERK
jgi:hypothetical protein